MWWHSIQHWLSYMTGSENTSGAPPNYNFWSGFGSDLTEVTIVGGLVAVYRKHNCHQRWCFRIGHHSLIDPTTGITYNLCRRHHPGHQGVRPITAKLVQEIHKRRENETQ